jgi:hypothetical protein
VGVDRYTRGANLPESQRESVGGIGHASAARTRALVFGIAAVVTVVIGLIVLYAALYMRRGWSQRSDPERTNSLCRRYPPGLPAFTSN